MTKPRAQTPFWSTGLENAFRSQGFLRDAREIAEIPDEPFARALADIQALSGFSGESEIVAAVRTAVDSQAEALARVVYNFAKIRRWEAPPDEAFLRSLENGIRTSLSRRAPLGEAASSDEISKIVRRSRSCMGPFPSVDRMAKAESLAVSTGDDLDEFSIYCDLRPVFNSERNAIEGFVRTATLRVVSSDAAGMTTTSEMNISESVLQDLLSEVTLAVRKMGALKQFAEQKELGLAPGDES